MEFEKLPGVKRLVAWVQLPSGCRLVNLSSAGEGAIPRRVRRDVNDGTLRPAAEEGDAEHRGADFDLTAAKAMKLHIPGFPFEVAVTVALKPAESRWKLSVKELLMLVVISPFLLERFQQGDATLFGLRRSPLSSKPAEGKTCPFFRINKSTRVLTRS
jgi:hypothetical protein